MTYLLRITVFLASLMLIACSNPNIKPSAGLFDNFTLAVYDSDNKLISNPIGDLRNHTNYHDLLSLCQLPKDKNIKACKKDKHNTKAITDIYVLSHGWNYTLEESIDLYNNYSQALGYKEDKDLDCTVNNTKPCDFHPYYIFISWPSTVRPISQTLKAVLPYSLADPKSVLGRVGGIIDNVVFHLPTVWKQSLNTYLISRAPKQGSDFNNFYDVNLKIQDKDEGTLIPFSIVLYELMKYKDQLNPDIKIHLIGHSYGTKLLTLSALDALKLWSVDQNLKEGYFEQAKEKNEKINSPIESLLLFNAAFEPWELVDSSFYNIIDPLPKTDNIKFQNYLKFIPRKAFVYSNYDYPNGIIFESSQLLVSNALIRGYTSLLEISREKLLINPESDSDWHPGNVFDNVVTNPIISSYTLGITLAYSPLEWTVRKVFNMPNDYWYHVNYNDTISEQQENRFIEAGRMGFNALHYFLPLDQLCPYNLNRQADKMGLFRSSKEALGRTGLFRAGLGRVEDASRGWLDKYVPGETTNIFENNPIATSNASEIVAEVLCKYGEKQFPGNIDASAPTLSRDIFYSFDGSQVLSGGKGGSHSDIRSDELTNCDPNTELLKRDYILNFTYNFTQEFLTEK